MNYEVEYYKLSEEINLISPKWSLMWIDLKSWLITTILMFAPVAIGALIVILQGKNLGVFSTVILLALGSLAKLFQKYQTSTIYQQ